jgi:hypothetical protein
MSRSEDLAPAAGATAGTHTSSSGSSEKEKKEKKITKKDIIFLLRAPVIILLLGYLAFYSFGGNNFAIGVAMLVIFVISILAAYQIKDEKVKRVVLVTLLLAEFLCFLVLLYSWTEPLRNPSSEIPQEVKTSISCERIGFGKRNFLLKPYQETDWFKLPAVPARYTISSSEGDESYIVSFSDGDDYVAGGNIPNKNDPRIKILSSANKEQLVTINVELLEEP